jgi:hypothetical protein
MIHSYKKSVILLGILSIFIFTSSCSLYYGCDRDNDLVKLTTDTKDWAPYSKNQTFVFAFESEEALIEIEQVSYSVEPFQRGDEYAPGTKEVVISKIVSRNFIDTIHVRLESNKVVIENLDFDVTFRTHNKNIFPQSPDKVYLDSLRIGSNRYTEVLSLKCNSCENLSEIVFEKKAGLVAYKLSGRYWMLKKI